jgi:outer membrane protein assembly factor BamB
MPLALLAVAGCQTGGFSAESGWSGAVVTDDVIYIGSQEAELLALDRKNGSLRWSFPGDNDEPLEGIYGSPAVGDELIFVGAYGKENGTLYAVNPTTRAKVWEFQTEDHIVGSPVVAGNTVIVGSSDGILYALDATQGVEKWRFQTENKIWGAPVVYEDIVYFGSLDHNVYAVTLDEGREIWRFKTNGAVASTPLLMGGRVYIGSFDRQFYALEASTGTEVWFSPFKAENWFWTNAVSDGATIYVGSLDGNLYALNADTGLLVWPTPFETGDPIVSAPALIPEGVIVANDKGDLFLVRTQDGQEIRSFSAKDNIRAPLVAPSQDSVFYFSAMNNSIRAADLEGGFWTELWCYNTKEKETRCE